ncbi:MAG: outer membrane beta-barrel protein, partial [Bacteroidaceae bacterium]
YRHMSSDGKHDFRISTRHDRNPVELIDQIAYRDDSQPLVVKLGNPDLKGDVTTYTNVDYTEKWGKKQTQWHVGAAFNYFHRNIAQSVSYNSKTGVYTYKPMNVSGAYNATAKFDFSRSIDEKNYWTWQTNADVNYNHSVDYSMLEGETKSYKNAVNTTILHENASIQFRKGMLNIRATGDIRWRHSKGKMRDFETLNATD